MQYVRLAVATALLVWLGALALGPLEPGKPLPWRWGMDFNGGSQLVYALNREKAKKLGLDEETLRARMELSRQRLRERIVSFQSEETRVALLGEDRILVEVPGVRDFQAVKRQIGKPQYLTVRGVDATSPEVETGKDWWVLPRSLRYLGKSVKLSEPGVRGEHIVFDRLGRIEPVGEGRYGFVLELTPEGQESCAEFTTRYAGRQICILLDDVPQDVLHVESGGLRNPQITTGSVEDARRLRRLLASGPLPLPFDLIAEKTVSPVLAAMRQSSLTAMGLGVALLVVFFAWTYLHRPYFLLVALASVALEVFLFLVVANKGWIRISLPQLAGLALLVGMSVDAFVLVFEHIERELEQRGGGLEDALAVVQRAFAREVGVIFWAATTTVATLGGLFFVEGLLHEYFVLLALGVAISLSAAIYLRLLMGVGFLARIGQRFSRDRPLNPWLSRLRRLDLLAAEPFFRRFYRVAVPLAVGVLVLFSAAGWVELGIDFRGGAQVVVKPERPVDTEVARRLADEVFAARCEVQASEDGQLTVRVPRLEESLASRADPGAAAPAAREAPEARFVARLREESGGEVTLIGVDLLGQAAALENVATSLLDSAWGLGVLFVLCALLYISLTVPLWVVLALVVDVVLVLALVVLWGLPVDFPLIAALLTFAGYSINDSIVVCHEIRAAGKPHMPEALRREDPKLPELVREAVRKGLEPVSSRVFLTSITTMLTMVPLLFCDGVLRTFGVVFVFGTALGTLSSVYIVGTNARDVVLGDTQLV
ncbi:MAG: hypothetical protein D6731_03720 [Planctomycetota bacterium]|nr:MAG: hypothetical protein D6731_03720 [Planctomycetota bacterium]